MENLPYVTCGHTKSSLLGFLDLTNVFICKKCEKGNVLSEKRPNLILHLRRYNK